MNFPLIHHIECFQPNQDVLNFTERTSVYEVYSYKTHYFIALGVVWVLCVHRLSNGLQQLSDETIVVTSVDYRLQEEPQAAVREWERDEECSGDHGSIRQVQRSFVYILCR